MDSSTHGNTYTHGKKRRINKRSNKYVTARRHLIYSNKRQMTSCYVYANPEEDVGAKTMTKAKMEEELEKKVDIPQLKEIYIFPLLDGTSIPTIYISNIILTNSPWNSYSVYIYE